MSKNKTAQYLKYAIGEIALVMIGILLALQVNNWNENRRTRNQELELLKNLKLEMQENLAIIDDYLLTKNRRIEITNELLSYTGPDYIEKEEDSLAFKFRRVPSSDDFQAEVMLLNAAQNSNSIKLIRDQQIKINLSKWEQSLNRLMELVGNGNEYYENSLVPIISNHYNLRNMTYYHGFGDIQSTSKHSNEMEKMFRSRKFENGLFRMKNFQRHRALAAKELKKSTLELLENLNKELNE